jgi:ATP/ADP translocase
MFINLKALRTTLRKLGIGFITLGIIGLMLQSIKDFDISKIHIMSVMILIIGIIVWIIGLIEISKEQENNKWLFSIFEQD